jgi:hypothetical protein
VIDVFLSYFFNTRSSDAVWRLVSIGKVVSSLLWLIDSILYILANVYEEKGEDDEEEDTKKTTTLTTKSVYLLSRMLT